MRPGEFAKRVGFSVKTLHRWDETGKLPAKRTPSGHRYYLESDLAIALGKEVSKPSRKTVGSLYSRIIFSTKARITKPDLSNGAILLGSRLDGR